MRSDFEIKGGIYLVHSPYELDLHNDYDFIGLSYSIASRTAVLNWRRGEGDWVLPGSPALVSVEFCGVGEFRFLPRLGSEPFSEDDCVNTFGYWTDEPWANGVFTHEGRPDPKWSAAIDFMSGAVVVVQAESANVHIEA